MCAEQRAHIREVLGQAFFPFALHVQRPKECRILLLRKPVPQLFSLGPSTPVVVHVVAVLVYSGPADATASPEVRWIVGHFRSSSQLMIVLDCN